MEEKEKSQKADETRTGKVLYFSGSNSGLRAATGAVPGGTGARAHIALTAQHAGHAEGC